MRNQAQAHSLAGDAAEQIRRKIVDGTLELGQALSETALAAELGVSKTPIREALRAHLIEIGRRKLMMPLWTELAKTGKNREWALDVYKSARAGLHPIAQNSVDGVLGYKP